MKRSRRKEKISLTQLHNAGHQVAMRIVTGPDQFGSIYVHMSNVTPQKKLTTVSGFSQRIDVYLDYEDGKLYGIELLNVKARLPKL